MSVNKKLRDNRVKIEYESEVNGKLKEKEIPLKIMVPGDFSAGTSKDRKKSLKEREKRTLDGSNTDATMKKMGINLEMVVPNKINQNEQDMRVKLKIDSKKAFSPDEIAKQVPQIKSLAMIKNLLQEMQSNIANRSEFARLLSALFKDQDKLKKMKEEDLKDYSGYSVPYPTEKTVEVKAEEKHDE